MTKNPHLSQIAASGIGGASEIDYKTSAVAVLPSEDLP